MSVLQVSLIAMVAVLLAIQLKGGRAEYGFLINLAAGIFLFFCIVGKLEVFIRAVEQIQSFLTLDTEYIAIMLKMVGIISAGFCAGVTVRGNSFSILALFPASSS